MTAHKNKKTKFLRSFIFPTVFALPLIGCDGGGGNGGDNNAGSIPNNGLVAITTDNAETVANAALVTMDASLETATQSSSTALGVQMARPGRFGLLAFAMSQLQWFNMETGGALPSIAIGTLPENNVNCSSSGTATVHLTDSDNSQGVSAGDNIAISFIDCQNTGDQYRITGGLTMEVKSFQGAFSDNNWQISFSLSMSNLSATDSDGNIVSLDGGFTLEIGTMDGVVFNGILSGDALTLSINGSTHTLSNFRFESSNNESNNSYEIDASGTVSSNELGGSVEFETIATFSGIDPGYPTSGAMVITGANNSNVTLTAQSDGINVQIDIDTDGDDTPDETYLMEWSLLWS